MSGGRPGGSDRTLVRTSKFLSLVLRHDPAAAGITLDEAGWADVDALLAGANAAGVRLDRAGLERIVAENDKKRFALSPDGRRIRASQGHSLEVDLGLAAVEPPPVLYHGTATRFLKDIRAGGLVPRSRQHVHLSADEATAVAVGTRHGVPAVLRVDAARMHADGHAFHRSENGVWLAAKVPAAYLTFPPGS